MQSVARRREVALEGLAGLVALVGESWVAGFGGPWVPLLLLF